MIYLYVLLGAFVVLFTALTLQKTVKKRSVQHFVRSIEKRSRKALEKGIEPACATLPRHGNLSKCTSSEMQMLRTILRDIDQAMRKNQLGEAERLYIQALTIRPDAYDIQAELAKLYLKTGREPKAEALYREIVQHSEDPTCFANLGLAYYQQGKYDLACEAYFKALQKDPKNPERLFNFGRSCMAAGHIEDAVKYLEKASVRLWRNTELLRMLADCYETLGKQQELLHAYERIHKVEPYNRDVRAKIAVLAA